MWENFIGQSNLIKELKNLKNYPCSLLLRGNSGYGKTTLARIYANSRGKYDYQLGSKIENEGAFYYNPIATTHIVDEIHELKNPEILYSWIDSGMSFVFCTNETDNLKEALRNRCIERFFLQYNDNELKQIINNSYNYSDDILNILVNRCRGVPRTLLQLGFLVEVNTDLTKESVIEYLNSTGYYENGFTINDQFYLNFIKQVRKASLNTIKSNLNLPLDQITKEIEPYLIKKGLISVGSGGRTYIGE